MPVVPAADAGREFFGIVIVKQAVRVCVVSIFQYQMDNGRELFAIY
jgi:hypothetical protein